MKTVDLMPMYRSKVIKRLDYLMDILRNQHDVDMPFPKVTYYNDKIAAGYANYRDHEIKLNSVLLVENTADMIEETVAHELAHLVVWYLYQQEGGHKPKPHGAEWRDVMINWFWVQPQRTHNYDVINVNARRQDRWEATCSCRVHKVSTVIRNRMAMGQGRRCRKCKSDLKLTGVKA